MTNYIPATAFPATAIPVCITFQDFAEWVAEDLRLLGIHYCDDDLVDIMTDYEAEYIAKYGTDPRELP